MADLWRAKDPKAWAAALERYEEVIAKQSVSALPDLDQWYRKELPGLIQGRSPCHIVHEEMVGITKWKMARGVWRGRNLTLVRGNDAGSVEKVSEDAIASASDPPKPIRILAQLAGVGPATASAVMAAAEPGRYPFLDDIVAAQVPELGKVAYSLTFYRRYAEALRERAEELGGSWTPAMVERALWAAAGGKAGVEID
jgi:hypothetical protein